MNVALKYEPKTLDEVIYPNASVAAQISDYANKRMEGNLLLCGPNGTGKTTVAKLLPSAIDGDDALIEQENMRELLKLPDLRGYLQKSVSHMKHFGGNATKLFIVAHELDAVKGEFDRFWTALDDLQDSIMLIATTNELMSIHQSIRSRCAVISFPALKAQQVLPRAQSILKAEAINLPDQVVLDKLKVVESTGSLRSYMRALNVLINEVTNNQPLPPASGAAPAVHRTFTVVQGSKQSPNNASV